MLEIAAVKEKAVAKQEQKDAVGGQQSLKKNLKAMFQRKGTILLKEDNENSELMTERTPLRTAGTQIKKRQSESPELSPCDENKHKYMISSHGAAALIAFLISSPEYCGPRQGDKGSDQSFGFVSAFTLFIPYNPYAQHPT